MLIYQVASVRLLKSTAENIQSPQLLKPLLKNKNNFDDNDFPLLKNKMPQLSMDYKQQSIY